MPKTKIITDSGADLPEELYQQLNIGVAPIYTHFKDHHKLPPQLRGKSITQKQWLEKYDLDYLYELLDNGIGAQTSAPLLSDFDKEYEEAFSQGYDNLLVLTLIADSRLTATNDRAVTAANDERYKGKRIEVISSNSASLGLGLMVLRAAEGLEQGATIDELVKSAKEDADGVNLLVYVSSFKYLAQSGRIPEKIMSRFGQGALNSRIKPMAGHVAQKITGGIAKLANTLNIKFILKLDKNGVGWGGGVRNIKQGETNLTSYVAKYLGNSGVEPNYFIKNHSGAIVDFGMHEASTNLQERIKRELGIEMPIYQGGTIIGSLAGRIYGIALI